MGAQSMEGKTPKKIHKEIFWINKMFGRGATKEGPPKEASKNS